MKDNLPGEYMDFVQSRQANGNIELERIFSLQMVTVTVSFVLLLALLPWILLRNDRGLREFLWLILTTVSVNATICGALSMPSDRYQSRVIWLLPFLLCLVAIAAMDLDTIAAPGCLNRVLAFK